MKTNIVFRGRKDKLEIVARTFCDYFRGDVLDVGCDQRFLERWVGGKYVGIDIGGSPSLCADITLGLPFKSQSFDAVVCFDVLEHIDNIHYVFDELCRVSRSFVIVGLPNMYEWRFRLAYLFGKTLSGKYGLPPDEPPDRHRWLFSLREAVRFVNARAAKNGFKVVKELNGYYRYRRILPQLVTVSGIRLGKRFANLFAYHYWALLERTDRERLINR